MSEQKHNYLKATVNQLFRFPGSEELKYLQSTYSSKIWKSIKENVAPSKVRRTKAIVHLHFCSEWRIFPSYPTVALAEHLDTPPNEKNIYFKIYKMLNPLLAATGWKICSGEVIQLCCPARSGGLGPVMVMARAQWKWWAGRAAAVEIIKQSTASLSAVLRT